MAVCFDRITEFTRKAGHLVNTVNPVYSVKRREQFAGGGGGGADFADHDSGGVVG